MANLPINLNLDSRRVLLVGGGSIALNKLEKIVQFTKEITIIAPDISLDIFTVIKENCLTLYQREYRVGDIDGFDIVVVATDSIELQKSIYQESRDSRVLVNSVDDMNYCDFTFSSFIKRDNLLISFSTNGASPAFSKRLRGYFEDRLPSDIGEFLDKMKQLRRQLPKGKERMAYFDALVKEYFEKKFKN